MILKEGPLERVRVRGGDNFSLAELWWLSSAGLLLGKEKNLPSSCWGINRKDLSSCYSLPRNDE